MRILLSNDDGIRAPGIQSLYSALVDEDGTHGGPLGSELLTAAPLTVQSATSHGVTFHTPLMVEHARMGTGEAMGGEGLAVDGRPADCIKLAVSTLWNERFGDGDRPDLVISGINSGANIGINVIYSGTVAAALEAAFLGVPSIAVSLHIGKGKPDWARAARMARRAIEIVLEGGVGGASWLGPHHCLNINLPLCETGPGAAGDTPEHPELAVCPMNTHGLIDSYERRESPAGDAYYWSTGAGLRFASEDLGTDVDMLFRRRITVTPLKYDLTDRDFLATWAERVGGRLAE
ncbi:MAG: 5'/3'-nucleotidase SurE [Planctomycetota bacterium]